MDNIKEETKELTIAEMYNQLMAGIVLRLEFALSPDEVLKAYSNQSDMVFKKVSQYKYEQTIQMKAMNMNVDYILTRRPVFDNTNKKCYLTLSLNPNPQQKFKCVLLASNDS